MATKKPSDKSTKAEILEAYNELLKEKAAIKSQFEQVAKNNHSGSLQPKKEEIATMSQPITAQEKMNYIIDNLLKNSTWIW